MIDLKTIKNLDTHPYVFGIRGEYLTQALMFSIIAIVIGFVGLLILVFSKLWVFAFIVFLLSIVSVLLVIRHFVKISKVIPFKDLSTEADLITHINFEKLTKDGN